MINEFSQHWVRGNPITYSVGNHNVDLKFLSSYMGRERAPVVRGVRFDVQSNITAGTALTGVDAHKIFRKIEMRDKGGVFYDLPGSLGNQVQTMEGGYASIHQQADLAMGAANTAGLWSHYIDFNPARASRSKDWGVPLLHFVDGGAVTLSLDVPYDATVTSATITPYFLIEDERKRELKPRMVWSEISTPANQAEFSHPVSGSIRALFISSHLPTGAAYTDLSGANYDTFESQTLGLGGSFPTRILLREYIRRQQWMGLYHASDTFVTGRAMPIITPHPEQNIGTMIAPDAFHAKLETTITGGRLVICEVRDRNLELALQWMGFNSAQDLNNAILERGEVVEAQGDRTAASGWDPRLLRRLPIRLPEGN
jgi:hypothetical protein